MSKFIVIDNLTDVIIDDTEFDTRSAAQTRADQISLDAGHEGPRPNVLEVKAPEQAFYLLENDGHNTPLAWKFRNQSHAEEYLKGREGDYEPERPMFPGYFADGDDYEDPDGTSWSPCDGAALHVIDKTGDK